MDTKVFLAFLVCCGTFSATQTAPESAFGIPNEANQCPPEDVRCVDGSCILAKWRCDGQKDCRDGSDEDNCEQPKCPPLKHFCDKLRCLPIEWRCDGQQDCQDGSDESPTICKSLCPESHFTCISGQCIPHHWKCDGERDCRDGDDEDREGCSTTSKCLKNQRMCLNQQCVSAELWCNGRADCKDKSDETASECSATTLAPCLQGQFRCHNGYCINAAWVCDGERDCNDSEDETTPECEMLSNRTDAIGFSLSINRSTNLTAFNSTGELLQSNSTGFFVQDFPWPAYLQNGTLEDSNSSSIGNGEKGNGSNSQFPQDDAETTTPGQDSESFLSTSMPQPAIKDATQNDVFVSEVSPDEERPFFERVYQDVPKEAGSDIDSASSFIKQFKLSVSLGLESVLDRLESIRRKLAGYR